MFTEFVFELANNRKTYKNLNKFTPVAILFKQIFLNSKLVDPHQLREIVTHNRKNKTSNGKYPLEIYIAFM